jgi:hypothetical protein
VALDLDTKYQFFRTFVALGSAVENLPSCLPMYGFDGTHSKNDKYRGVILTLLGRFGNGNNMTIALAVVHSENEKNIQWFFENCDAAGIPFAEIPIFSDRGHILGASDKLADKGIKLNLKFCTIHIIRNVHSECRIRGKEIENMTLNVQGAKTEDAYNEALDAIEHRFGKPTRDYIAGIDPVHWCVFANMPHYIPNNHRFTPAPLFNWRSTNFVESDNNNMLINGLRKATPFGMLQRIMRTMMMDATARRKRVIKWENQNRTYTPFATKLRNKERQQAGSYQVDESSPSLFSVSRVEFGSRQDVDVDEVTCTCDTFLQNRIPCRHIIAALRKAGRPDEEVKAFHSSYLMRTYKSAFGDTCVGMVVDHRITKDHQILPSPFYRRAGRPISRRYRSRGEDGGKTYKCRGCNQRSGHNIATCTNHASGIRHSEVQLGRAILPNRLNISFMLSTTMAEQ